MKKTKKGEQKESKSDAAGGLVFVGCIMLGLGIGLYYGNTAVGLFLGLGTGFILFGILKAVMKK